MFARSMHAPISICHVLHEYPACRSSGTNLQLQTYVLPPAVSLELLCQCSAGESCMSIVS